MGSKWAQLERTLAAEPSGRRFNEEMVRDLPDAARRYLLHSIAPGTRPARSARLDTRFQLKPPKGGGAGEGGVLVRVFGMIPIVRGRGPDVTRSSRGRLAGESIWLPSAFLPGEGISWEAIDGEHARVTLTIDGEAIPLTLRIDERGRLQELTMLRHGDVGVESWQAIPFGMEVEEETTFGGYTLPTRLRGGWWYGTERYVPSEASVFEVVGWRMVRSDAGNGSSRAGGAKSL